MGREHTTGDAALDAEWFLPNVWPTEIPELAALGGRWMEAGRELDYASSTCWRPLSGCPSSSSAARAQNLPHTFNINRYPAMNEVGAA